MSQRIPNKKLYPTEVIQYMTVAGLMYALVPAGSFQMGCAVTECAHQNEAPVHSVTISRPFWIGTTEVTVGAYKQFAKATGRSMPPDDASFDKGWKDDRMPINNVTWFEAAAYCKWAGGSLPTEAQWEYASRAGGGAKPYGPLSDIAWTMTNSGGSPHDVGLKKPNAFGLYDIIGNVAEWTNDWFGSALSETSYPSTPQIDPAGPLSGPAKIARGGFYAYPDRANRSTKREAAEPNNRAPIVGMRCTLPG